MLKDPPLRSRDADSGKAWAPAVLSGNGLGEQGGQAGCREVRLGIPERVRVGGGLLYLQLPLLSLLSTAESLLEAWRQQLVGIASLLTGQCDIQPSLGLLEQEGRGTQRLPPAALSGPQPLRSSLLLLTQHRGAGPVQEAQSSAC